MTLLTLLCYAKAQSAAEHALFSRQCTCKQHQPVAPYQSMQLHSQHDGLTMLCGCLLLKGSLQQLCFF